VNQRQQTIAGYICILPAILGLLLFTAFPMLYSLYLSFTDWNVLTPAKWIGLDNYVRIFTKDFYFVQSLKVTTMYAVGSVLTSIVYAFAVALILNANIKGRPLFRALFYLPYIVPVLATSMIWIWLFDIDFGLINHMLGWLDIPKQKWINSASSAVWSLILVNLWASGNVIVIFLAGLQDLPKHQLEAVEIDGGNYWHKLTKVMLPLMTPIFFFNIVLGLIGSFTAFTQVFAMTSGGPANATLFYVFYIFREGFENQQMGYACALGWVLFVIVSALTLLIFRTSSKWVHYEGGRAG